MNQYIINCFYKVTRLENNKITFEGKLCEMFDHKYPQYSLSEQRVADQKRAIGNKEIYTSVSKSTK